MGPLDAKAVLDLWEGTRGLPGPETALVLLAAADPSADPEELASLSLGERDRRLLELRKATLGDRMEAVTRCPECRESLDLALDARELLAIQPEGDPAGAGELRSGDLTLRFRPATSADLLAAARAAEPTAARRLLAEHCLLVAERDDGGAVVPADLTEGDLASLSVAMAEADPLAEVILDLTCPECGHRWQALFEIAGFFAREVALAARRLLVEVATLARAYGWREEEILALPPLRRRAYVEMVS